MAELVDGAVLAEPEEAPPNAGEPAGGRVRLGPEEAAHLCERGRLEVRRDGKPLDYPALIRAAAALQPRFEVRYPVYRSLRLRGYRLAAGPRDFRLYKRGSGPGGGPSEAYVWALSEREPVALGELAGVLTEATNVHKRLLLGMVDSEGDATFYEARRPHLPEGKPAEIPPSEGVPAGSRVLVSHAAAAEACEAAFFGRVEEGRLWLSRLEAAYLAGRGVLKLPAGNGIATPPKRGWFQRRRVAERGAGGADFQTRLAVYRDLRDRGLVARTGFKFGAHFRVYSKWPARHSDYLVHVLAPDHVFTLEEMARAVRLAQSVRKRLVFAHLEVTGPLQTAGTTPSVADETRGFPKGPARASDTATRREGVAGEKPAPTGREGFRVERQQVRYMELRRERP
ncbi:MAG: tRNA-intron lyase [Halobacteria archaeon]